MTENAARLIATLSLLACILIAVNWFDQDTIGLQVLVGCAIGVTGVLAVRYTIIAAKAEK